MKITFYNLQKGIRYLKNYGIKEFFIRLSEKSEPDNIPYSDWYNKHKATEKELAAQRLESAKTDAADKPSFAIILTCRQGALDKELMAAVEETVDSITIQSYDNWKIYMEVLPSKIGHMEEQQKLAYVRTSDKSWYTDISQDYVIFIDAGDTLTPDALYEAFYAITNPSAIRQSGVHWNEDDAVVPDMIYTDNDVNLAGDTKGYYPEFKPDFNMDLLRSNNYVGHMLLVSRALFIKAMDMECEAGVDRQYDFVFKCAENAERIVHIPKVLYHGKHGLSEGNSGADMKAISCHLKRQNIRGQISKTEYTGYYRVQYECNESPLVSILIPNKDETESLGKCLKSISESTYDNLEVIIIENNSESASTFEFYDTMKEKYNDVFKGGVKVVTWESHGVFNYSAINNFGRSHANGEYLVLLNNDIELISRDWIEEMLGVCSRADVGIVGAELFYPDDTIQHAGIVAGIGGHVRGIAANMLVGLERGSAGGYMHRASTMMDYSAVTAACLMIKAAVFDQAGGFEEKLTVAFNDVDLCLKVRKAGYLVVYDPYVQAYHYESKSRGQEDTEEKLRRFQSEIEFMRSRWNDIMRYGDPYYNPNLSRVKNDYSLNGID